VHTRCERGGARGGAGQTDIEGIVGILAPGAVGRWRGGAVARCGIFGGLAFRVGAALGLASSGGTLRGSGKEAGRNQG
jgi:hypothetical protein